MKSVPPSFLALVPLGIALLTHCSKPAQMIREASTPTKPAWVSHPPAADATFLYVVGVATDAQALQDGKEGATQRAMAQIASFLGTKTRAAFEETSTESDQRLEQRISATTAATIQGAEITDTYHERLIRIDGAIRRERYNVWVLARFPKAEAERERLRQEREKGGRAKTAYALWLSGLNSEQRKQYVQARWTYREALKILVDLDENTTLDQEGLKTAQELRHALDQQMVDVSARLRRISVSVSISGPGDAQSAFLSSFIAALSKRGFTVSEKDGIVMITGVVTVREGGVVMNNNAAYAEGSLAAIYTPSNQTIGAIPVKAKGFHRIKEKALLEALTEAGAAAGAETAEAIVKAQDGQ